MVEWCRAQLARGRDTHTLTRAALGVALRIAGCGDDAMAAANGLIESAEATRNPFVLSFAILAYGFAFRDTDPDRARDALRRGLVIARDSGNRSASPSWRALCPTARPSMATRWRRSNTPLWPSATTTTRVTPPISCRVGCPRRASSIGSDVTSRRPPSPASRSDPLTAVWVPEFSTAVNHLRDVLGDQIYESLAREGETMTTAAIATYAYDEIDQARTKLNAVSE